MPFVPRSPYLSLPTPPMRGADLFWRAPEPSWVAGLPATIRTAVRAFMATPEGPFSWWLGPGDLGAGPILRSVGMDVRGFGASTIIAPPNGAMPTHVLCTSGPLMVQPAALFSTPNGRSLMRRNGWALDIMTRHSLCETPGVRGPLALVGHEPVTGLGLIEEAGIVGVCFGTTDDPADGWYLQTRTSSGGGPPATRVALAGTGGVRDSSIVWRQIMICEPAGDIHVVLVNYSSATRPRPVVCAQTLTTNLPPLDAAAVLEFNASGGLQGDPPGSEDLPIRTNEIAYARGLYAFPSAF